MPAAVFSPTVATLPASPTARLSGSPVSLRWAGARRGRGDAALAVVVLRLGGVRVLRFALAARAEDAARVLRAAVPLLRFVLRWPGRERGRLPRTPGLSSRSAAITRKNSGPSGVNARSSRKAHFSVRNAGLTWTQRRLGPASPRCTSGGMWRVCGLNEQFRVLRNPVWGYTAPALRRGIRESRTASLTLSRTNN